MAKKCPRRLAILAQYDPEGGLPPHVRIHLERLREVAQRIVLVSNSPIADAAMEVAESVADRVLIRPNIGWDFAAWRDAISNENMEDWDGVILTNSSVVGPLFSLKPIFNKMDEGDKDFWGMVLSNHRGKHLQSYFLSFNKKIINSKSWEGFWYSVKDYEDKISVIKSYEVGLTKYFSNHGFTYAPFVANPSFPNSIRFVHIDRLNGGPRVPFNVNWVNRTVEMHRELISDGMPYLKASLLWGKDTYRFLGLDSIEKNNMIDYPWDEVIK